MKAVLIFIAGVVLGAALGLHPLFRYEVIMFNGMPVRFDRIKGELEMFPAFTFSAARHN